MFITLRRVLPIPTAIAPMAFADGFTSRTVYGSGFARIVTLGRLVRQDFASRFDRA
jgi:hypothetical protein